MSLSPETLARAREWADARIAGESLQSIGSREGLSRERIRQVIRDAGLSDEVAAARAAARAEVVEARAARVREGAAARAAARKFTVAPGPFGSRKRFSDAEIVAGLSSWLDAGGSGFIADWNGVPSSAAITRRLGWARAIEMAGGRSRSQVPRSDRVSEADALAAVVAFLLDPSQVSGGAASYSAWARTRGRPSDQTVRNRFGSWGAAKRAALEIIQSESRGATPG